MTTVESRLHDRKQNNFDFLRFLAATFVIFSHSFALRGITWEPLNELTGYQTFGRLGVAIFFVMSGLLITRSWLERPVVVDFLRKRALRILPGYLCALFFSAFVIGPLATQLSETAYFGSAWTYRYLANAFVFHQQYALPGVFSDMPFNAVNGSLWTLPIEVTCYVALLALGVTRVVSRRVFVWFAAAVIAYCFFRFFRAVNASASPGKVLANPGSECWVWFLLGSLSYVYRDRIKYNRWGALISAGVYLVTLSTDTGYPFNIGYLAAFPSIAYLTLYAAQVRAPILRGWGRWGDASYGMYIYAFPLQQSIVHCLGPGIGLGEMFILSMGATVPIAYASWHLVEKPMIALAHRRRPAPTVLEAVGLAV